MHRREGVLSSSLLLAACLLLCAWLGGCAGGTSNTGGPPAGDDPADGAGTALHAIPSSLAEFAAPLSGYLAPAQLIDGVSVPGGTAARLWLDEGAGRMVFALLMQWDSAEAAAARLDEMQPRGAAVLALGNGGWQGEDATSAGFPGFRALAFRRGSIVALVGAGVLAEDVTAPEESLLTALAAELDGNLAAQAVTFPHGGSAVPSATVARGSALSVALAGLPRAASADKKTAKVSMDLEKGGKKMGSITFKLVITATGEQCTSNGHSSMAFIVDIYISEITLGSDDGDGFGKGAGDIMVGGDISVSFDAGGAVSSGKAGSFATGEIGDVDADSTAKEGDDGTELPRFIGSVKGCGIPSAIDFDILVRDSDEGTDVQDIIGAGGAAAAEYLAGSETAKRVGEAIDKAGAKAKDESGTDGMKKLRERDGDDIGEAHDKQRTIEAE